MFQKAVECCVIRVILYNDLRIVIFDEVVSAALERRARTILWTYHVLGVSLQFKNTHRLPFCSYDWTQTIVMYDTLLHFEWSFTLAPAAKINHKVHCLADLWLPLWPFSWLKSLYWQDVQPGRWSVKELSPHNASMHPGQWPTFL